MTNQSAHLDTGQPTPRRQCRPTRSLLSAYPPCWSASAPPVRRKHPPSPGPCNAKRNATCEPPSSRRHGDCPYRPTDERQPHGHAGHCPPPDHDGATLLPAAKLQERIADLIDQSLTLPNSSTPLSASPPLTANAAGSSVSTGRSRMSPAAPSFFRSSSAATRVAAGKPAPAHQRRAGEKHRHPPPQGRRNARRR